MNQTGGSDNPFGQALGTTGTELPVEDFDLRKVGGIINQGVAAKAYELRKLTEVKGAGAATKVRKVSGSTHVIRAYFLPWGPNKTYSGRLGVNADFFFTPTLNGCTFAHSGNGPTPSVAHANFVDLVTTITDQNAIDADLALKFGAAPASTLIKTTYKQPALGLEDYRATVVGVRTTNTWSFYYQNYRVELLHGALVKSGVNLCLPI